MNAQNASISASMKKDELIQLAQKQAETIARLESEKASSVLVIDKHTKVSVERLNATLNSLRSQAGQIKAAHADKLPILRELDGGNIRVFTGRALPALKEHVDKDVIAKLRAMDGITRGLEKLGLI